MPPERFSPKGLKVPTGRLSRIARLGGMATNIAGGMLLDGARQLASGNRPSISDLLLTPANALKVTMQLGQMRGAAMKLGQLMSMDSGDFLPKELSEILSRLRADAQHMPVRQLQQVLSRHWGKDWRTRFDRFNPTPIAAASIGQVHRATTRDGRDIAVKVQYPGVRISIDSDVDNVATLLRLSNLLPQTLDITPMLVEAKRQLHEEADYAREGQCLEQFAGLLKASPDYGVPLFHADLSGTDVLAMSYIDGVPIEAMAKAPQDERDRITALLIDLVLRELFAFGLMQTDPNFANYRYAAATRQIILLDFGATRALHPDIVAQYRTLLRAALAGNRDAVLTAAIDIGFLTPQMAQRNMRALDEMLGMALALMATPGPFDFGNTGVIDGFRDAGMTIAADRRNWHIPPIETLFVQRKLGGVFLLASRLKARVDVRSMLERYV